MVNMGLNQKRIIYKFLCLVLLLLIGKNGQTHSEGPMDERKIFVEASAVFTATIKKITVKKSRCSETHSFLLEPVQFLQGSLNNQKTVLFSYDRYFPYKAKWFWQSDCPSVYYIVPPVTENVKEGDLIIAAAAKNQQNGAMEGTATWPENEKERITGLVVHKLSGSGL